MSYDTNEIKTAYRNYLDHIAADEFGGSGAWYQNGANDEVSLEHGFFNTMYRRIQRGDKTVKLEVEFRHSTLRHVDNGDTCAHAIGDKGGICANDTTAAGTGSQRRPLG